MGDKTDTRKWDAIMKNVRDSAKGAHVKVGVLAAKGGDAPHPEGQITMVELAAIHEFGSPAAGIPQRSFIRRSLVWNAPWLPAFTAKLAAAVMHGKTTEAKALAILGQKAVAEIRNTITKTDIPPPLKPDTIARKHSERPLVDKGILLKAITYLVETGKGGAE